MVWRLFKPKIVFATGHDSTLYRLTSKRRTATKKSDRLSNRVGTLIRKASPNRYKRVFKNNEKGETCGGKQYFPLGEITTLEVD